MALFRVVPAPLSSAGVLGGHIPALLGAPHCIVQNVLEILCYPANQGGAKLACVACGLNMLNVRSRPPDSRDNDNNHANARIYHSRLIIMTKLCGGVGFRTHLAGEALSVHLFHRSRLVLARLGLQKPKRDRPADHLECASRSKHETGKRTIARRSSVRLFYSPHPTT